MPAEGQKSGPQGVSPDDIAVHLRALNACDDLLTGNGGTGIWKPSVTQMEAAFPHEYRSLTGMPGSGGQPGGYSTRRIGLAPCDLETDPGETNDVAEKHPEIVEKLKGLADKMREDLGDSATQQQGKGVRPAGSD